MIDRQGGKIVWECDSCDATLEYPDEESSFTDGWNAAKRDGWRAAKIGTEWVHVCPNCEVK